MKVFKRLIKKNAILAVLTVILTFLSIISQFIWTIFIGKIIDSIAKRDGLSFKLLLTMGFLLLCSCIFIYLSNLTSRFTAEKMAHTLRMDYVKNLLDSGSLDEKGAFEAMSKAQNELSQASEYMSNTLFDIFSMALSGILALFFLLFENAFLTLIILIPMIFVCIAGRFFGKKLDPLVNNSMNKKIVFNKTAYSLITGFDVVQIFDAKDFFKTSFENKLDEWAKVESRKERVSAVCNSLSGILSQMPLLILFAAGAIFIWRGQLSLGGLIIFLNMTGSLLRTLMNLPSWAVSMKSFLIHLSRCDVYKEL